MNIAHEGMDDMMEHGCRTCTHDHACNQGRCKPEEPKRTPGPLDRRYLHVIAAATLGLWGVVIWAVLA